jgi:glycosyltransferase involved in cell wall biosynthesis
MTPLLSILMPTVQCRAHLFAALHAHVLAQAQGKPVEVIVASDNKEISIGKKRQNLLESAKGDYVVFIDDDDWVSGDYVDSILAALATNPDCVGFKIQCHMNGGNPQMASASLKYPKWGDNQDGFRFVRSIYHKCPHRRSIGLQVGFPDLRYCEDKPYSEGIMKHLKTEVYVDKVLYIYRFKAENFAMKYGFKQGEVRARGARSRPPARGNGRDYRGRRV